MIAEKSRPVPLSEPTGIASKKIEIEAGATKWLCMCGLSKNMPYCDGSHKAYNEANGTSIAPFPVKNETEETKSYFACMCGHSKKRPFCDGSHRSLKSV